MVRMGSHLSPSRTATDDYDRIAALAARYPIGGVLLFNAAWPQCADTLAALHDSASAPLLVGSDIERGVGQQVDGATRFPHALACGHAGRRAVEVLARITALEARACGIHWAFAPVADLRNEPRNPIIANRAFGDTPQSVSRHVDAFIRTAQAHGLATTAKHAPGHGRTTTDSHVDQPRVSADADTLAATDARPFRAAIRAGTTALMTAHVVYPALDAETRPATASPPILRDLFRTSWGFDGLVVSDSLLMDGIDASGQDAGAQAAALVDAGVDMLLDPPDAEAVIDGLARAVASGTLDERRLNEAATRVEQLASWIQQTRPSGLAPDPDLRDVVGQQLHTRAAHAIAAEAIDLSPTRSTALPRPLGPATDTLVVRCSARPSQTDDDQALRDALAEHGAAANYTACPADAALVRCVEAANRIHQADQVVALLAVEPAAWQDFRLADAHRPVVDALRAHPQALIVATGSPHVLDAFSDAWTRAATYSDSPASQRALIERLFGTAGRSGP